MSEIDWAIADSREWRSNCWGQIFAAGVGGAIGGFIQEIDAAEVVTLHNYRLAEERRRNWRIIWHGNTDEYDILDESTGVTLATRPTKPAAMAEFVRLDREAGNE